MHASWEPIVAATAVAWVGAAAAAVVRDAGGRLMRPLVYITLMFFGASAIFDILPQSKAALSWPIFLAAVALGYGTFWVVGRYVAPICPACAMRSFENGHYHAHTGGAIALGSVLAVHCFLDGLGVSAASTVERAYGLRVFAAIAFHKLPEGFALALMLRAGNRSASRAFGWAAAIEAVTIAGALAPVVWPRPSDFWLALVLAHVGGTFLYLSVSGLRDALAPAPPLVAPQHGHPS